MDEATSREEELSRLRKIRDGRHFQLTLRKEYVAELDRLREKHFKKQRKDEDDPQATQFIEEEFGGEVQEISATFFGDSVISIGLFREKTLLFACSGTSVQYWHKKIQQPHAIFVTSKCLADKFESSRTRDDNLRIRVRLPDNTSISGFLGLYDDDIAIVVAFTIPGVYPVNICEPLDLQQATDMRNPFAFGRTHGGRLMGAECSSLHFSEAAVVSCDCAITEAGLGGPVIWFDKDGNGHFAGVMVDVHGKFLPAKALHEKLLLFGQVVHEATHFRGYSLPKGLYSVIPAGFMTTSLWLKSLGYPLPPPLVFELNGTLVGRFEEMFGELHACEGFYYDIKHTREQLREDVVQNLSRSVVLVSSFKGGVRCFACTGLLIANQSHKVVLTSASLFRTGDDDDEIDPTLRVEVFLSRNQCVAGRLDMYHQDYNIAIVSLMHDLTRVSAQDIFTPTKSSKSKVVVAIGRPTKDREGLLMAAVGDQKGRGTKNLRSELDCKEVKLSTCKIKKVGIGGPLIRSEDGSFVGMNFYAESGLTPYLPRNIIVKVLKRGFNLLSRNQMTLPIILDMDTEGNATKKNRWPVPKPYWYLAGNRHPIDQLVGKVPM